MSKKAPHKQLVAYVMRNHFLQAASADAVVRKVLEKWSPPASGAFTQSTWKEFGALVLRQIGLSVPDRQLPWLPDPTDIRERPAIESQAEKDRNLILRASLFITGEELLEHGAKCNCPEMREIYTHHLKIVRAPLASLRFHLDEPRPRFRSMKGRVISVSEAVLSEIPVRQIWPDYVRRLRIITGRQLICQKYDKLFHSPSVFEELIPDKRRPQASGQEAESRADRGEETYGS
jgi:hypothetical protein